jgi:hypothetical protein
MRFRVDIAWEPKTPRPRKADGIERGEAFGVYLLHGFLLLDSAVRQAGFENQDDPRSVMIGTTREVT